MLETFKYDIRQSWKIIRQAINTRSNYMHNDCFTINGITITDPSLIAQKFNEYFVNIGTSLASKIPDTNTSFMSFLKGDYKNSFVLYETDCNELISITKCLPSKKSTGFDNIPMDIVKLSLPHISACLCKIINNSFNYGKVPDLLKISKVCPVFKKGNRSDISNYRPISVLPCFSKIFEKLVYNRLVNYLDKYFVLYKNSMAFVLSIPLQWQSLKWLIRSLKRLITSNILLAFLWTFPRHLIP